MTESQRRELEFKKENGTITKKELKRLKQSQSQGRSSVGYSEKQKKKYQ